MSSSRALIILTAADVDQVLAALDLEKAIASQAAVFDAFSSSATGPTSASTLPPIQNPHRTTIETELSTSLFMPARVAELGGSTCKIVSVPKASAGPDESGGLPAVTVVLDDKGAVRGLVNARRLTAMRNACGSALFLRRYPLAEPIRNCVFFGSGEQIYAHASVFLRLHPSIQSCTFVIRRMSARADSLVSRIQAEHPHSNAQLLVSQPPASQSPAARTPMSDHLDGIIRQAQIIVTATSSQQALFDSAPVSAGTRVILIGSYKTHMREVDDALVRRAERIVVDSKKACLQEAGELIAAGLGGGDLEELGSSGQAGEMGPKDIILFKSVGLGVQDVAIAKLVLDEAISMGIGTRIDNFDG